jgi:hypothetical protein
MSIFSFIQAQKTHVIYGVLIVGLVAIGSFFLSRKPTEVVKTVTKTNTVDRNIVQTKVQYVDRVIVKKDANGSITTTTEHIGTDDTTTDKSRLKSTFASTEKTSYLTRYSLGIKYPVTLTYTGINLTPTQIKEIQIEGGIRLFSLPIFATITTNIGLNQYFLGVRYEF